MAAFAAAMMLERPDAWRAETQSSGFGKFFQWRRWNRLDRELLEAWLESGLGWVSWWVLGDLDAGVCGGLVRSKELRGSAAGRAEGEPEGEPEGETEGEPDGEPEGEPMGEPTLRSLGDKPSTLNSIWRILSEMVRIGISFELTTTRSPSNTDKLKGPESG
jgi:hypothetical protein